MRTKLTITAVFTAMLAVSGCVASDLERAGVGAVVGGVGTAVVGGSVATGVVVGAAAGALCDDVNLC
ncbi:hypothetical protein [Gymnodinialimonas hymeniacidonis]|uniref:hypothetical protein n=1 Tax=Gymnodinialimonas hymeniacidonis TaxID=3126508 RepID=UPI0034C6339C